MKALLIIFIILAILLLLPLGVDGGYRQKQLIVGLKIGPLNIKLFPRKQKVKSISKSSHERKSKKTDARQGGFLEKFKMPTERQKLLDILKLMLESLGRFRKKLSIDYLRLRITVATGNPFKTAMQFAGVNIAANAFFPLFDNAFNIKDRDFGIYSDFCADKSDYDLWLTATFNLLDIFIIVALFGIDYLKLKIKEKRQQRANERNETNG